MALDCPALERPQLSDIVHSKHCWEYACETAVPRHAKDGAQRVSRTLTVETCR